MSIQFGVWNFDGQPVPPGFLGEFAGSCSPYTADNETLLTQGELAFGYRAFHTTRESRMEHQPCSTRNGTIITWDGRLDNRAELMGLLRFNSDAVAVPDLALVVAAYDRWGQGAFGKLEGDWAVAIWDSAERTLILAKDFLGSRHLYYSLEDRRCRWSTVLDPLILTTGRRLALSFDWIAGYLAHFPEPDLTPYAGIQSVRPGTVVRVRNGIATTQSHWSFDAEKRIHHSCDRDYEKHFLALFSQAVRRRLRADAPVLAELSGGMDSSSIVCLADAVIAKQSVETPRIDTVSYYNDDEPNWNERPFFEIVEQKRERTGSHIQVATEDSLLFGYGDTRFPLFPAWGDPSSKPSRMFSDLLATQGNRVLLSGIGGDEVTGGVPTPIPELADLFAKARIPQAARQLKVWALARRKPWMHLFFDVLRQFLPRTFATSPDSMGPPAWLSADFVKRHGLALNGSQRRLTFFGALPSFQGNIRVLGGLQRQLACAPLPPTPGYERRYPFLDRTLLEFLFAIPREQLVRPGQRRSLMRRALAQLVPPEILDRKRKAFVVRMPMRAICANWAEFSKILSQMRCAAHRIVALEPFAEALQQVHDGKEVPLVFLLRTLSIEYWLRQLEGLGAIDQLPFSEGPSHLGPPSVPCSNARVISEAPTGGHFPAQGPGLLS